MTETLVQQEVTAYQYYFIEAVVIFSLILAVGITFAVLYIRKEPRESRLDLAAVWAVIITIILTIAILACMDLYASLQTPLRNVLQEQPKSQVVELDMKLKVLSNIVEKIEEALKGTK